MNETNIISQPRENVLVNNIDQNTYTNLNDKNKYRTRATILYEELEAIKPIDNTINNVIYLQKNIEKGLSVNTNINNIRQMWTEYRLLYNEKINNKDAILINKEHPTDTDSYILTNFDEIFKELNQKVEGVDGIIQDLNNMKQKIHSSSLILGANQKSFELYMQQERTKLEQEKEEFELLKTAQSKKLQEEHKKIANHYKKIQELITRINSQINKLY